MAAMACMEEGQRPIMRTRRSGIIPLENGKAVFTTHLSRDYPQAAG